MDVSRRAALAALAGAPALLKSQTRWRLLWSDEFNGPAGAAPDNSKWTYDLGASGWGNHELENYTDSRDNSFQDGAGNLVIQALSTGGGYTSARLKTQNKFSFLYGRVEARIKIPFGQGLWPAFWMLGANIDQAGWPTCGEIDVMENVGFEPSTVHGTVHGPGYSGANGITKLYALPGGGRFADDFHIFSVQWQPDMVQFMVDRNVYHTVTPASIPSGTKWAYDHPFFVLLNVAVGGDWPGSPNASTTFPQQMLVDYVRIFEDRTHAL